MAYASGDGAVIFNRVFTSSATWSDDGSIWIPTGVNLLGIGGTSSMNRFVVGQGDLIGNSQSPTMGWTELCPQPGPPSAVDGLHAIFAHDTPGTFGVGANDEILRIDPPAPGPRGSPGPSGPPMPDLSDEGCTHAIAINSGPGNDLNGVWSNGSALIAVGDSGALATCDVSGLPGNCNPQALLVSASGHALNGVWADSNLAHAFAVGDGGTILKNVGGSSAVWTADTSPTAVNLHAVWGAANGPYFAVGDNGTILVHP
jgi:hypothetical protein